LTQAALAQQVGCAAVTIRRIEADARRPSRQMAERLAECLAITPTERAVFVEAARARLAVDQLVLSAQPVDYLYPLPIASETLAPTVRWHHSRPIRLPVERCRSIRRSALRVSEPTIKP
jgi:transcriptional regulator with XRE-family HTH domain